MSLRRSVFVAAFLFGISALAEAPWVTASSRVEGVRRVDGWAGIPELGAGYLDSRGWSGELAYAPASAVIELRAGKAFSWVQWQRYGLAAQVGLSALSTVKGPVDFGVGPHVGLVTGWTWSHFLLETGVQAGAEIFFRSGGPRYPLRWILIAGPRVGPLDFTLTGKMGADLESGLFFTLRYEGLLMVRWRYGT